MRYFRSAIFLMLLLAAVFRPAKAQPGIADSLRAHLATLSPADTMYVLDLLYLWIAEGKSNPESAFESARRALETSRSIHWVRGEINALNSLALTRQRQGHYAEALQYYLPALELSESSGNKRHISKTHNNLGILYQLTADYPKALVHFRRVLEVEERPNERASVYNNIGIVFKNSLRQDSALAYYRAAQEIHERNQDKRGLASTCNNIGIIERDQGRYEAALTQLGQALTLYRELHDLESCAVVMSSIGGVLVSMGDLAPATDTLSKAFELAKAQGSLTAQQDIANYFQQAYAAQRDFQQAYFWAKSHKKLGDSLQGIQKRDELAAIRAQFESDKTVALLQRDIALERSRRLLWTASAIGLLLLLFAAGYALRQARRRRRIESEFQEQEIARLRAEDEARRLREEKLSEELEFRNRELTSQTLHLVQKNELLQTVSEQLKEAEKTTQPAHLRNLQRLVEANLNDAGQWEDFKKHFEAVHPGFFQRLLLRYPQLTAHDLRYFAYLRLNLSSKEIAALLNVSLRGVETHRHRLRKKLNMSADQDLTAWAMQM